MYNYCYTAGVSPNMQGTELLLGGLLAFFFFLRVIISMFALMQMWKRTARKTTIGRYKETQMWLAQWAIGTVPSEQEGPEFTSPMVFLWQACVVSLWFSLGSPSFSHCPQTGIRGLAEGVNGCIPGEMSWWWSGRRWMDAWLNLFIYLFIFTKTRLILMSRRVEDLAVGLVWFIVFLKLDKVLIMIRHRFIAYSTSWCVSQLVY